MASLFRDTKLAYCKTVTVDSTMSTAVEVAKLARGARILGFVINGAPTASATVSLGSTTAATEYVSAASLAAGYTPWLNAVDTASLGTVQANDSSIYALVSATGGTWQLTILFSESN